MKTLLSVATLAVTLAVAACGNGTKSDSMSAPDSMHGNSSRSGSMQQDNMQHGAMHQDSMQGGAMQDTHDSASRRASGDGSQRGH